MQRTLETLVDKNEAQLECLRDDGDDGDGDGFEYIVELLQVIQQIRRPGSMEAGVYLPEASDSVGQIASQLDDAGAGDLHGRAQAAKRPRLGSTSSHGLSSASSSCSDEAREPTLALSMSLEPLFRFVAKAFRTRDVTEILGFNPTRQDVPMTDTKQCGCCGNDIKAPSVAIAAAVETSNSSQSSSSKRVCTVCGFANIPRIDYGSMTDALVKVWRPCSCI